jgi:hypothetical protein
MKDIRRPPCPRTGKQTYKNAGEAKRALALINASHVGWSDVAAHLQTPYRCRHCNRWHLTCMDAEQSKTVAARLAGA